MDQTESEPQAWTAPKWYVHVASDGSYQIVDADGKPLVSPPAVAKSVNGGVTYTDPWGNEIPEFYPPAGEAPEGFTPPTCYVDVRPDGSYDIVDSGGNLLASPPDITGTRTNGDVTFTDPWGNKIHTLYPPPGEPPGDWPPLDSAQLRSKYFVEVDAEGGAYTVYDGKRQVLGRSVSGSMPVMEVIDEAGTVKYVDPSGNEVPTLPQQFNPPECYVHTAADGTFQVVDADGNLLPSPPEITRTHSTGGEATFTDPWGNEISTLYPPPGEAPAGFELPECYVHFAPDGSYQVVDSSGNLLPSPPAIIIDGLNTPRDPWGNEVPTLYPPPGEAPAGFELPECYVHFAPDGSYQVVDADGNLLPSPPMITIDGLNAPRDPWGNEIPTFYPPAGQAPADFAPPECYVHVAADGSYQVVDADGNLLPSPPVVTTSKNGGVTYTDPWGNEIPPLYPPSGEPPEEWPPPDYGEAEPGPADETETEEAESEVAAGEAEGAAAEVHTEARAEDLEVEPAEAGLSEEAPSRAVDDAMVAGPEPGPAVLPTPLAAEDAVAIAEGEVSTAAELEGKWRGPGGEEPELLSEEPLAEGASARPTDEVEAETSEDELAFKFFRPLPADQEAQLEVDVEDEELEGKHFQPRPPPEQEARFEVEIVEEEPTFTEMEPVEELSEFEAVEVEELEPEEPDDLEP